MSVSIVLHVLLGVALAGAVWALGLGWLRLSARTVVLDARHAYPVGLLVTTAASFLAIVSPWLAIAAVALVGVGVVGLARTAGLPAVVRRGGATLAWSLPGSLGLALALGFLLHGPTDEVDSSAFGDMLYYVNKIASLSQSVIPFDDLLAEGQRIIYTEAAPSFVGGVLDRLPGFDLVLYNAASTPAFLVASLCIGIGLVERERRSVARLGTVLALALLAVASVPYPTWITESPPVAFALPLAFSVDALLADRATTPARAAAVGAVLAVDLFMTKVVGLVPLGIVLAYVFLRRFDRRTAALAAFGLAAGAAVAIAALFLTAGWYADLLKAKNYPGDALRGLADQLTQRDTQAAAPAVTVAAELLLGALLLRTRLRVHAAALGASVAGQWFVGGYGFDIAVGMTVLLAALALWRESDVAAAHLPLLAAAGGLFAISAWFRDISAIRAGLALVVLLAVALFLGFAAANGTAARWFGGTVASASAALAIDLGGRSFVAFAVAAGLVGIYLAAPRLARPAVAAAIVVACIVAAAAVRAGDFALSDEAAAVLTTDDYDVWRRVERLVPPDGLVFTSQTGPDVDARQGWNNYPSVGRRQLYLAGWYDGRLTSRRRELERRLSVNTRVLSGELSPRELDLDRDYSSFFAVLPVGAGAPSSFRRVYANGTFAIYRIES